MEKLCKRVGKIALTVYIVLFGTVLFSDSVRYKDGTLLTGKIIGQNTSFIFLESEKGDILRIGKEVVSNVSYLSSQKKNDVKLEVPQQRKEIINFPTNTQLSLAKNPDVPKNEPVLGKNMYYLLLKDAKSYLIKVNGFNFKNITKIYLENQDKGKEQEFYNLQATSVEVIVDPNELGIGFYDLVIESKSGYKVKKEYFIEVKEP
jgi:hypothetical protein